MAVTALEMTRTRFTPGASSGIFQNTVSIAAGSASVPYLLPIFEIYAITASITGDGAIQFTNDTKEAIEADTATWASWDGFAKINFGVTAFRIARTSGTVVGKVTVKTKGA